MNSRGVPEKSIVVGGLGCCWPRRRPPEYSSRRPPLPLAAEEEEWPALEQGSFSGEESFY